MEKYNDSESVPRDSDAENTAFLNTHFQEEDVQRRRNMVYLTLFNLFIFTLSMLSLICAVMSQKDDSGHSAAKLMDQFGIFCKPVLSNTTVSMGRGRWLILHSTSNARSRIPTRQIRAPQPSQLLEIRWHHRRRGERLDGRSIPYAPLCHLPSQPISPLEPQLTPPP